MHFPAHFKPIKDTGEELVSGRFIIPGNKFVKLTNKLKYLGTYLAQDVSDDNNINERINVASKTFNALLGKEISLHIRCRPHIATTINIVPWGYDAWALSCPQQTQSLSLSLYPTEDRNFNEPCKRI